MILGWARRHFASPTTGLSDPLNHLTNVLRGVSVLQITSLPSLSQCEFSVANGTFRNFRQDFANHHGNLKRNKEVGRGAQTWDGSNCRSYSRGSYQFFDRVQNCKSWHEVRNAWNECTDDRNRWHAEVVLLRCKKLPSQNGQEEGFLDGVLEVLIKGFNKQATPRQVVGAIHSLAKIGYTNSELLDRFVKGVAGTSTFTRRDIVILTYALGAIENSLGPGSVPSSHGLIDRMAGQIVSYLDHSDWHLGEFELANLLTGLGQLRIEHEEIVSAVRRLVSDEERLGKLRPYGLVEMFYRTSQLGLGGDLMETLVHEITQPRRLVRFKEVALSTILFTFADLGYRNEAKVGIIVDEVLDAKRLPNFLEQSLATMCYSLKKIEWKDLERLGPLFDEISRRLDMDLFKGLALCNIVCGLSHMGCKHQGFWSAAKRAVLVKGKLAQLSQKGLTALFCGFLTAGVSEEGVYSAIISEFVMSGRLVDSSEADLSNFLCSISLMEKPDENSVRALLGEVGRKAPGFSDGGLLSVLRSLEKMGFSNSMDVTPIMEAATESGRLKKCSEDYLAWVAHSIAALNVRAIENPLVGVLFDEILKESRLRNLSIDNIARIVYTLGKIKQGEGILVRLIFEAADRGLENCSEHSLSNIIFGLGGFSFPKSASILFLIEEVLKPDRIDRFSTHTVVTILLGLAQLGAWKDKHLELTPIFDTIKRRREFLKPTDVSKILHSLACIGCRDIDLVDIMAETFTSCEEMLGSCDESTLSTVMHSLSRLKFEKGGVWERLWKEAGQEERMLKFSNEAMSNMLGCLLQRRVDFDAQADGVLEERLVETLTNPSRLSDAHEASLVKTLEYMATMEECRPSNLQSLLTEMSHPGRADRFGISDRVRIVRAFAKIRTENDQTITAMNGFLDTLSLSNLLLFSIDYLVEFMECAKGLQNPSAKLVHSLKQVVGLRRDRLGRKTVSNLVEMMRKVGDRQNIPVKVSDGAVLDVPRSE
ncbi:hypothetical protein BSKO_08493 [Bryopsis sp. KO-2023]|nr:hypothetical protein BSKO_08493 [Bryopsis sp. KO-2023]